MNDPDADDIPAKSGTGEADHERQLLRSARLDVPSPAQRQRSIEQVLTRQRAERELRPRLTLGLSAAVALAVAVSVGASDWLRSSSHTRPSPEPAAPAVTPAPRPEPAPPPARPCPKTVTATGWPLTIDDMEDQNARALLEDGRSGRWSMFSDGTGQVTPEAGGVLHPSRIPGGRADSQFGLHVAGGRFTDWGLNINVGLAPPGCYDASIHAGLQLWARGKGRIQVGARLIDVVEVKFGGLCEENCYSIHNRPIDVGPTWARYTVRWSELEQPGPLGRVEFDARRLVSIDLSVYAEDTPFDVWIDDVEFLPR